MKRLKKIPLRVWLFYLLLISILFTGATFASYKSESSGGSSTRVALFANDVNVDITIADLDSIYPGMEPIEIPVTITNFDNDKVCEVSQSFEMKAEAFVGVLPLSIKWKEEAGVALSNGNVVGQFHANDGEVTKSYKLLVSWPVENGQYPDSSLKDEIEVIRLKIHCEQID